MDPIELMTLLGIKPDDMTEAFSDQVLGAKSADDLMKQLPNLTATYNLVAGYYRDGEDFTGVFMRMMDAGIALYNEVGPLGIISMYATLETLFGRLVMERRIKGWDYEATISDDNCGDPACPLHGHMNTGG